MADFADDATVRLRVIGTHLPGLSLDDLPTVPRNEWVEVSGAVAGKMLATAEEKPELPHEKIEIDVVSEGAEGVDATAAAEELAEAEGIELSALDGTGKDGRVLKSDVQEVIE